MVSADGVVEWEFAARNPQDCWRLPDRNILFAYVGGAMEVTPTKEVVWEYKAPEKTEVHGCQPLPDGSVLVVEGGSSRIVEVNRGGTVAREIKLSTDPSVKLHNQFRWELNENDFLGNPLRLMAGCQRLPDGNTIICNYLGHGHIAEQPQFFEVTRDKKVVWEFADHAHFKTINQMQALDIEGDVTKGEIQR